MRNIPIVCSLFAFFGLWAQDIDVSISQIPEELKRNADAVVRLDETHVQLLEKDRMLVNVNRIVTVLNKQGNSSIDPYIFYDPVTKIKDFSVRVFAPHGNEIERIKKSEFKDVSAVSGGTLYGDSRMKYFQYTATQYPYTVQFKYSYQTVNTAFIRPWTPIDHYGVSVQKSKYRIEYPPDAQIRIKEKNFGAYPIRNSSKNQMVSYELENLPAQRREAMSPPFFEVEPMVLLALNDFHLEGYDGSGHDWESFGKWQYITLLKNKDLLFPNDIVKLGTMLKGIDSPLEKTKKIYQYVQDNTRYISVQLGIGGWMPIEAKEVNRVKYGDCKGLTNYTKALLKSQGIDSYYSVVWAGPQKRGMEPDFASMQGNHVILNVPLDEEEVWLECTSQKIPFGFLGDFTDDRDVLVITPQGGKIKRTPKYIDKDNKRAIEASYDIDGNGNLFAKVQVESTGIVYDNRMGISQLSEKKKDERYKKQWKNITGLKIINMDSKNDKESILFKEEIELNALSYATIINDEIIVRPNAFDVLSDVPKRYRDRKMPLKIPRGFYHTCDYEIRIPKEYKVKVLPDPVLLETKFGTYMTKIDTKGDVFTYQRQFWVKKGTYPKEEYGAYRDFLRKVAKSDNQTMVLTK